MYETVIYEKKGHIAYITLNRPERLNAYNLTMNRELGEVWEDFKKDDYLRVAILTGAGKKAFCAGVDVKDVAEAGEAPLTRIEDVHLTPLQSNVWKPVICAVNGLCTGAGMLFVVDSDICIGSENATFFDSHVNVGMVAAMEPAALVRRIPIGIVLRMYLMGNAERMSAQRAYEVGLLSQVVPFDDLLPTATRIAEVIAENAPLAVRGTKIAAWKSLNLPLFEAAQDVAFYILRENWLSEDFKEGPRAFAEKRKPQWKGR